MDWLLLIGDTVASVEAEQARRQSRSTPTANGMREARVNYRELESG